VSGPEFSPSSAPSEHIVPSRNASRRAAAVSIRLALGTAHRDAAAVDWPAVLQLAAQEMLAPLAWARSRRFIQDHADAETAAAWRRMAIATHLRGQLQLQTLRQTLTALDSRRVDAVVLKGLPLGAALYGDAFVRCSSDIDLYVPADQRAEAAAALVSLGWERQDGEAPWHEAWARRNAGAAEHLELHSLLVSDHLAHLPAPSAAATYRDVAGELMPALDGPFVAAYLSVHLATHQMPPLLWLVDFATIWSLLPERERVEAARAADAARVGGYLAWAQERAAAVLRVRDGDDAWLEPLGFARDGRRDVHSIVRHLMLAASAGDRWRVLAAFVVPRKTRGSIMGTLRFALARVRTRLASLAGVHRTYTPEAPSVPAAIGSAHENGARPLRVERAEMVSLVREVVGVGGALRVRAPGGSMLPTIPRGALVRIAGVSERVIARGDVVLALTADGEPVLHRVVDLDAETLIMRGDAALSPDPAIPRSRVIGVATHVTHLGVERELTREAPRSLSVAALKLRRRLARAVRGGW
jgi:hypothetical protein